MPRTKHLSSIQVVLRSSSRAVTVRFKRVDEAFVGETIVDRRVGDGEDA